MFETHARLGSGNGRGVEGGGAEGEEGEEDGGADKPGVEFAGMDHGVAVDLGLLEAVDAVEGVAEPLVVLREEELGAGDARDLLEGGGIEIPACAGGRRTAGGGRASVPIPTV